MYRGYKIITVTPAGRKNHLEILIPYLLKNKSIIDKHVFWINTSIPNDINYINKIVESNPFFSKIQGKNINGIHSIHQFFTSCVNKNTIYIRFDDDICYIGEDAIKNLVDFRIDNPKFFLVYPIIINNSMDNYLIANKWKKVPGYPFDQNWYTSNVVVRKHQYFLDNINNVNNFYFSGGEPFRFISNINCICWFGKDFATFGGIVNHDEERWLTTTKTLNLNKWNCICGNSIVVHYSFWTQRHHLNPSILEKYKELSIPKIPFI